MPLELRDKTQKKLRKALIPYQNLNSEESKKNKKKRKEESKKIVEETESFIH